MSETTISIGEKAIEKSKFSGWSVVASAMLIVFFHMMIRGSFATLLQSMVASTGWSTGTVAAGSSIFMAMYGLFAFLVGTYINKLGCRLTYSLHGIIMGVGLFLCSYSQQPWQYWLSYAIIGIGSGAFWAPVTSMVRQWFIDKLGLAMGLTTAASGMAMFLGPIISMLIISKLSWQIMMKVFGVVLIVGIVAAAQFTKMKPEDVGQKPLGYDTFMAKMNAGSGPKKEEFYVPFKWAVKHKVFWTLAILWFCSNFAEFIVFSHAINYVVKELGYDKISATYIYCLIGFFFTIFAVAIGNIVDKISKRTGDPMKARKNVLTFAYLLTAITALWLNYGVRLTAAGGTSHWAFILYAILFGIGFGCYIPSVAGLVGLAVGRKEMPPAWGLISLIGMAGGAGLGPYIAGALRDLTGSYFVSIWLSTIFYILACILVNIVKQPTREEVWND
ncbi:MAG TPA: MFS transporter [Peptococcaceae bacterium]|nr:MFS transporter [Peptococcaceae bacterium]